MQFLWLALLVALQFNLASTSNGGSVSAIEEFYRPCKLPEGYGTTRWNEARFGSLPMYDTIRGEAPVGRARDRLKKLWGEPIEFGASDEERRVGYVFCRVETPSIGVFVLIRDGSFIEVCENPWDDPAECAASTRRVFREASVSVRPWVVDYPLVSSKTGLGMRLGAENEMKVYQWLKRLGEP